MPSNLTIINDNRLRGVIAPADELTEKALTELIDLIEWSSPAEIKEAEERIAEADRDNSWIPMEEMERRLEVRLKDGE